MLFYNVQLFNILTYFPNLVAVSLSATCPQLAPHHAMYHSGLPDGGTPSFSLLVPDLQHVHPPHVQLLHTV